MDTSKILLSDIVAPVYNEFLFDWDTKEYYLFGGRIGAKGDATYTKALLALCKQKAEVRVYVPQQGTIKNGVLKQIQKVAGRLKIPFTVKTAANTIRLQNGSEIICEGLAIENTQKKAEAFKGGDSPVPIIMIIFDEVAAASDRERISVVTATYARQAAQTVFIWNPPRTRGHWTFDLLEEVQTLISEGTNVRMLKTSIWDLPLKWTGLDGAREEARRMARFDPKGYMHAFEGIPVGLDDTAYPVSEEDILLPIDEFDLKSCDSFYAMADNGSMDATVFCLYGVNSSTGTVTLINMYYHSGRETSQRKAFSIYAKEFKEFVHGVDVPEYIRDRIEGQWCDSIVFTDECDLLGLEVPHLSGKKRGLQYETSREVVLSGRFKVLDHDNNRLFVQQMMNANVEMVTEEGRQRQAIAKVDNRRVKEHRQIHALDTFTYLCVKIGNKLQR